ncbi:MAG: ABC transporter substrate-binding protein [Chloroflexi bacterium]|nr:ABC transporter substrate-binding protein [Chloroflexota bacterium]
MKGFLGLTLVALVSISLVVSACTPAATPTPTKAPAAPTKASEPTKAPAPAATKAPEKPAGEATKPAASPAAKPATTPQASLVPLAPPVSVKVGELSTLSGAGLFVGIDKGFFKELGLEVELVSFKSGADMIPALGTGQLDIGRGAPSAGLFNAIARGVDIRIVSSGGQTYNVPPPPGGKAAGGLMVRKDLVDSGRVRQWADLKGLILADNAAGGLLPPAFGLYRTLIEKGGFTKAEARKFVADDVKLLSMPDQMIAFANKAIDAGLPAEPFATQAVENGLVAWFAGTDELYPGLVTSIIMASPKFVTEKPEVAKRFVVGYLKGFRAYHDAMYFGKGKDEVIDIISRYTTAKDKSLIARLGVLQADPNGYVNVRFLENYQNYLVEYGGLEKAVSTKQLFDPSLLDSANQVIGKYQAPR